jgi:hypothetical protein
VSRAFNGGTAADSITFAAGTAPPDQGPITIAVLARASTTAGWTGYAVRGFVTSTASWALLTSNNAGAKLFIENDFGNGVSGLTTSWAWYVATKASGSALPRFHVFPIGGSWTHTNNSANVSDGSATVNKVVVGGDGTGNSGLSWRGSIAVVAAWDTALSDLAIEAACTTHAADTLTATPKWMVRLNQASTATSVSDDTGSGGNQSAISGTSVDADDPPGYNYALSASGAAPTGIAAAIALGQPTTSIPSTAPTGIAGAIALGQPATALNRSASPGGIAVTAGVGSPATALNLVAGPTGIALAASPGPPTTSIPSAAPTGIALTTSLGLPTAGAQGSGAAPAGIALSVSLGVPATALTLSAAPTGIARTVLLGQPSPIPPTAYRSAHPRITTSSTARRIETDKPAARITTSSRPGRITD